MWHRLSWCAPHTSAGHALPLTTLVSVHDDHVLARTRQAWEARVPTRCTQQHGAWRPGAWCRRPRHALLQHEQGTAGPEKDAMAFLDDIEATTYRQPPRSTRRNALPVELIDGSFLMGHKYLACALV